MKPQIPTACSQPAQTPSLRPNPREIPAKREMSDMDDSLEGFPGVNRQVEVGLTGTQIS